MNRKQLIIRAILEVLANHEGEAVLDTIIHAEVNLRIAPNAMLSEFDEGIRACEELKWVIGIRTALKKVKWKITDTGRAEQLENP